MVLIVKEESPMTKKLAVFDLDGTLSRTELFSVHPWQLEWANESAPGYRRFPYQCRNPSVGTGTQKAP